MQLIPFVADFETRLITDHEQAPRPVCMSWAYKGEVGLVTAAEGIAMLRTALETPNVLLIGANFAFDVLVSVRAEPSLWPLWEQAYRSNRVTDVQLRQCLLDFSVGVQRRFYNLGAVCKALETPLQPDKNDPWRCRYGELDGLPISEYPEEAKKYALEDAVSTMQAFQIQEQQATQGSPYFPGRNPLISQFHEARGALALRDLANVGLTTDPDTVSHFRRILEDRREKQVAALKPEGLITDEYKKDHKAIRARLDELGETVLTPSGKASMARKRLISSSDPDIRALTDWPQSAQYLVGRGLAKHRYKRDTGSAQRRMARAPNPQPSLDNDSCTKSGDPLLETYAEYASTNKTLTTDFKILEQAAQAPHHALYRPMQSTGRTSNGADEDGTNAGNHQNMPRTPGVCECYVPPEGWVYVDADYPAIELRTFAQVALWWCGFSKLAEDMNSGIDAHLRVAAELMGVTYEEANELKSAKDPGVKQPRTAGKGVNFGRKGRMGAARFVEYCWNNYRVRLGDDLTPQLQDLLWKRFCKGLGYPHDVPLPEALHPETWKRLTKKERWKTDALPKTTREAWDLYRPFGHAKYLIELHDRLTPEFPRYSEIVQNMKRMGMTGRDAPYDLIHPVTQRLRAGLGFTDIHNYPFQGLAVDIAKAALFEVMSACRKPGDALHGCKTVLFVHDSITLIAPLAQAQQAARRLEEIMQGVAEAWLPDVKVPVEAGLLTRLTKHGSADPEHDEHGNIKIWDPWERAQADAERAVSNGDDVEAALKKAKWPPYVIEDIVGGKNRGEVA